MNLREQRDEARRKEALLAHLKANRGRAFDAASLSQSYNLAPPIVERAIREAEYGY